MSRLALNNLLFRLLEAGLGEKLTQLQYIFRDELSEESRARINSLSDLFNELKDYRVIHIDNLRPLKEALGFVGRQDLVESVEELERQRAEQTGPLQIYGASLQSHVIRFSRAVKLQCNFRMVSGGVVVVGAALILRRCDSLQEFMNAFTVAVLPAANTLRAISEGSLCFTVQAENLSALQVLWQHYQDGTLQKNLQDFLITEEINQLADGQEVMVNVNIDEQEYKEACLDLMIAETKALKTESLNQRGRSNSDSNLDCRTRDAEEEVWKLTKFKLFEGEVKDKHYFGDQCEDMDAERITYVQRYLAQLQDTPSVMSETTDSGLGTHSAPSVLGIEEDSDISGEPRFRDVSYDVIKELSRRLENDVEAYRNVRAALQLTDLGRESVALKKVISFFPETPVRLLKDVFDALQLYDLVELLEKVKVNHSSLLLQSTLQEVRALRKTDERPTAYHSNVAVLVIHHPDVRAEISERTRKFFIDLNSDNDLTIIPGLRRNEQKWWREDLKSTGKWSDEELRQLMMLSDEELRQLRMQWKEELNEIESTKKLALDTFDHWIQNKGRFTFFFVLDFAGVLSECGEAMKEKLEVLSSKEKFIFTAGDGETFKKLPKTLLVSFPLLMGGRLSVDPDAVGKILSKRWQTLDLCSMIKEMKRTTPVTFLNQSLYGRTQITDNLSSIVMFKKLEGKESV